MNETAMDIDPVCGMQVDPASPAGTVHYDGKEYHFCSKHCAEKFRAHPEQYLGGAAPTPPAAEGMEGDYTPLIVVITLILAVTAALGYRDWSNDAWELKNSVGHFMIGFFLVFAGFKLLDLKGFADGYQTYDLLAARVPAYGYLYPFIELFFGVAMIIIGHESWLLWAEIAVMSFSGLGVAIKLAKKEPFQCACLGTVLKVPLTKVTLIEDFGMAALAAWMLLLV